jgi:hypothetical protein
MGEDEAFLARATPPIPVAPGAVDVREMEHVFKHFRD